MLKWYNSYLHLRLNKESIRVLKLIDESEKRLIDKICKYKGNKDAKIQIKKIST